MNSPMTFLWPQFLWLLRRKKKMALRYASLSIVREAMGAGQSLRRHFPPLLFLLAMAAMLLAAARPFAVVTLPSQQETIILAMDVIRSTPRARKNDFIHPGFRTSPNGRTFSDTFQTDIGHRFEQLPAWLRSALQILYRESSQPLRRSPAKRPAGIHHGLSSRSPACPCAA